MTNQASIGTADARLVRLPVDPPRGDAIQKFDALELPIVDITDHAGHRGRGFEYTIGTGGTAILSLLHDELLQQLITVRQTAGPDVSRGDMVGTTSHRTSERGR